MQKKMSEAGKAKATAFLKTLADVCIKNGDHALTTMECLVEITAEMEEIAARDKVPITAVMDAANLKKTPRTSTAHVLSDRGKAEAGDLWKAVRDYFAEDSIPDITFSNCVGSFITTVETIAKEENLSATYVLDHFAACIMDFQNGLA